MPQPKDKDWLKGYKKKDPFICCLQETYLKTRDTQRLKVKGWKKIFHANGDKKKDYEKTLEDIIIENFPKMGQEIITQVQETQSPKQDKPKAKHPKTHINQTNKDQTQRTNIKSSKGKTTNNTQGDSHKDNS